jgi:hypothetical protein
MARYTHASNTILRKYKVAVLAIGIVALMIIATLVFVLLRQASQDEADKREMLKVQSAVSKLAIIPKGEDPTLATVKDKTKLTDDFLKSNAENGDKVLVYIKAKKVFVYRPGLNRIAAIGPLELQASAAEVRNARILTWTGNGNTTVTQSLKQKLVQTYPSSKILDVGVAKRQDYPTTIIIDLTEGDKYDLVTNMIGDLGAKRGVLPQGEQKPEGADVLIITGLDKHE